MRYVVCATMVLWAAAISAPLVSARAADPPAKEDAAAKKAGPEKENFDRLFAEWKEILADLRTLQAKFYRADEGERSEIDRQWKQAVAKGDAMEPKLVEAAAKAYAEAPNTNGQITTMLLDVLLGDILVRTRPPLPATENYERAHRLGKLLIESGCDYEHALNPAGIAAYAMQDYETAEKYLKAAVEKNRGLPKDKQVKIGGSSDVLDRLVRAFLANPDRFKEAWKAERKIREAEAQADDLPRVLLKTSKGDIELELFENEAPNTVANFISLIEKGYYDGLTFHRVLPGFMAQGGCPTGDGTGDPGYAIPCECYQENHRNHFRGSLAMAKGTNPRTGLARDTAGSQFYITFVPTVMLDGEYTVFGRVVKGFDVLHRIQRRDPEKLAQPEPDKIVEMTVLRDRGHEYQPKKVEP